jgi:hypothetical protein
MHSYHEVLTQDDMDRLLRSIRGFHDSMTKEIHLINRGAVLPNQSMDMLHRFDAQVLIQSQWEPFAVELLFTGIRNLQVRDSGEYWGASGIVENRQAPVEERRITMKFDTSFTIVSDNLQYRDRRDWLGHRAFFGSEVPSNPCIPAHMLYNKWRQCSQCSDAWEAQPSEEISRCPNCGAITQLRLDGERARQGTGI